MRITFSNSHHCVQTRTKGGIDIQCTECAYHAFMSTGDNLTITIYEQGEPFATHSGSTIMEDDDMDYSAFYNDALDN